MRTRQVEVPEELLRLLHESRLGAHTPADQVTVALAVHLFLEEVISIGKASELAGIPRPEFAQLLVEMGLPTVRYDEADYEEDVRGIAESERRFDSA